MATVFLSGRNRFLKLIGNSSNENKEYHKCERDLCILEILNVLFDEIIKHSKECFIYHLKLYSLYKYNSPYCINEVCYPAFVTVCLCLDNSSQQWSVRSPQKQDRWRGSQKNCRRNDWKGKKRAPREGLVENYTTISTQRDSHKKVTEPFTLALPEHPNSRKNTKFHITKYYKTCKTNSTLGQCRLRAVSYFYLHVLESTFLTLYLIYTLKETAML